MANLSSVVEQRTKFRLLVDCNMSGCKCTYWYAKQSVWEMGEYKIVESFKKKSVIIENGCEIKKKQRERKTTRSECVFSRETFFHNFTLNIFNQNQQFKRKTSGFCARNLQITGIDCSVSTLLHPYSPGCFSFVIFSYIFFYRTNSGISNLFVGSLEV